MTGTEDDPALAEDTRVDGREPIIFITEPSTGKTMLAPALAVCARRVRSTTHAALADQTQETPTLRARTRRRQLRPPPNVVLDELEYLAPHDRDNEPFFQVIFERNKRQARSAR